MASYSSYAERNEVRNSAIRTLQKLKKKEGKKKRYRWRFDRIEVSHTNLKRLKEMVEDLGYEYSEGTVDRTNG